MAAIAPWFHLRLPFCGPGFESQAHHLSFFNLHYWNCIEKMAKINKKRPGLAHVFNNKLCRCWWKSLISFLLNGVSLHKCLMHRTGEIFNKYFEMQIKKSVPICQMASFLFCKWSIFGLLFALCLRRRRRRRQRRPEKQSLIITHFISITLTAFGTTD